MLIVVSKTSYFTLHRGAFPMIFMWRSSLSISRRRFTATWWVVHLLSLAAFYRGCCRMIWRVIFKTGTWVIHRRMMTMESFCFWNPQNANWKIIEVAYLANSKDITI